MRVLIISHLCYPEPDLKALPFAKQLVKEGHEVQVLTDYPNYPEGKIYKGYKKRLLRREQIDGVEIIRFLSYVDHSESNIKRIVAYISFALIGAFWGLFATRRADVVYVNMTPAPVAFPALVIKLFKRTPVVLDIQDLWPETVYYLGIFKNRFLISMIEWWCKKFYQWSDHVVVPSKGLYNLLLKTNRVPGHKLSVIYNWSADVEMPVHSAETVRNRVGFDRFTILYAGNIGVGQGLQVVLDAAELLLDNKSIMFAFIGGGIEKDMLEQARNERGLDNVKFLPRVPVKEVGDILNSADALLVHLKRSDLFDVMIPGKTQAYLRMGKPILVGVNGEAAEVIESIPAGVAFEAENAQQLAEKAQYLSSLSADVLNQFGERGSRFYQNNFSIEVGTQKFMWIFSSVIPSQKALQAKLKFKD